MSRHYVNQNVNDVWEVLRYLIGVYVWFVCDDGFAIQQWYMYAVKCKKKSFKMWDLIEEGETVWLNIGQIFIHQFLVTFSANTRLLHLVVRLKSQ